MSHMSAADSSPPDTSNTPAASARNPNRSAQAYADMALTTRVLGASPAQLISLLFEGALAALSKARVHLEQGQVGPRGQAISKAIEIIESGLKSSLNHDLDSRTGKELARQLAHTYELIVAHLLHANLHADVERLALAQKMLALLFEGWQQNLRNLAAQGKPPSN